MKVGLFGGSFNPVHLQHLAIGEQVLAQAGFDEVWLVPVFRPVHKPGSDLLPFDRRWELLEAAVDGHPGLRVCDLERRLGGPSYTVRLVRHLRKRFPDDEFHLVIGSDSLRDLPTWKDADVLVREVRFVVVARPGVTEDLPLPGPGSRWVTMEPHPASSTTIRAALRQGRCRGLPVPPATLARIVAGDLYDCQGPVYRGWISAVREREAALPPSFRAHLDGVARQAAEYAAALGLDPRAGFLAGLAHDLFRLAEETDLEKWSRLAPGTPSRLESTIPMLAHGRAAAGFLTTLRPAVPREVVAAVRAHTFPQLRMAPMAQALVLGDALEPGRGKPEWDAIRQAHWSLAEKFRQVVARKREKARRRQAGGRSPVPPPATAGLPVPHD
ncbi:MAG: nicotinate (nicotinamide) nucleotide adenylyltransferase [Candidatus Riflebacteria bacterium]|nr:nicotinate (nicotinamide) nucleotide adenylyltransferase [Candidatus Riflebacteria bacterium]